MSRLPRALGVLLVGSVALVGCGGGDGDEKTSATTTVAVSTSADRGGDTVGGSPGGVLTPSDCVAASTSMAEVYGGIAQAMAHLGEGLDNALGTLEGFAAKAPSEIRGDLEIVADGFATFVQAMREVNFNPAAGGSPPPDAMAKMAAATEQLEKAEFTEAAARVSAWLERECGA